MKEFVLFFRMDITNDEAQPTPEQMKKYMQLWMEWIDFIAGKGQLADGGNHLSREGRVLKPNNQVFQKPYTSENVSVAGYIIIYAKDLNDATSIAKKCPILAGENTSVEVREVGTAGA
jgi:hypothetical protein